MIFIQSVTCNNAPYPCESTLISESLSFYDFFDSHQGPFLTSGPMNLEFTCISHWHRVSILISIVAESVIMSAETMARMSGATVNSSPVNPSTTVPHRGNGRFSDYTILALELQII